MKTSLIVVLNRNSPANTLSKLRSMLHQHSRFSLSLVIPLSYLEKSPKIELSDYMTSNRIELINTLAYASDLAALDDVTMTEEILLNEYALAHYFGSLKGFDGDDLVMIKDLKSFLFPKQMCTGMGLSILDQLGYENLVLQSKLDLNRYSVENTTVSMLPISSSAVATISICEIVSDESFHVLEGMLALDHDFMTLSTLASYLNVETVDSVEGCRLESLSGVSKASGVINVNGFETLELWDSIKVDLIEDEKLKDSVRSSMATHRSLL